jgi:hypothetical protein
MLPLTRLLSVGRRSAIVTVGAAAMLLVAAGGALAADGYGPPPPPPPVPGGFSVVVTSQTLGPAGGIIGPVKVGTLHVTIRVPAGAFPVRVQITVTAPDVSQIGSAGFTGFRALGGVGIEVQEHGSTYPGDFLKPLTMHDSSGLITSSDELAEWNGSAFVLAPGVKIHTDSVSDSFDSDPDFVVLGPTSASIPGGTTAPTGKPFLGQGILAGVLLLLGAGGIVRARRPRTHT